MTTALAGFTGFVGSNILAARGFDDLFNSSNLTSIAGGEYELVVSAAARADSHRINQDEDADLREVMEIVETISRAKIEQLVLISTVCVYPGGAPADEDSTVNPSELTPYGRNRLIMEEALRERFDTTVIRLPQLYGANMKKGIVFDLLNHYRVEHIRPQGLFQYYDLRRLWSDIDRALGARLDSLNIATPALSSERVAREAFGIDIANQVIPSEESPFSRMYTRDMQTRHSDLFGGPEGYLVSEDQALEALKSFVTGERRRSTTI